MAETTPAPTSAVEATDAAADTPRSIVAVEEEIDEEERERREHEEYVARATGATDRELYYFDPRQTAGLGFKPHLQPGEEEAARLEAEHESHDSRTAPVKGCPYCLYEENQRGTVTPTQAPPRPGAISSEEEAVADTVVASSGTPTPPPAPADLIAQRTRSNAPAGGGEERQTTDTTTEV